MLEKDNGWSIGRVLQLAKLQEKRISGQQFKGFKAEVSKSDLGVLCSWYTLIVDFSLRLNNLACTGVRLHVLSQ